MLAFVESVMNLIYLRQLVLLFCVFKYCKEKLFAKVIKDVKLKRKSYQSFILELE